MYPPDVGLAASSHLFYITDRGIADDAKRGIEYVDSRLASSVTAYLTFWHSILWTVILYMGLQGS